MPRISWGVLPRCNALRLLHPTLVNRPRCCGLGVAPLLFAEVRAQGQERRHGRRRRRRRYRDVPSASFRQTFCLNRGNPTQEGEQVGVAFLLVTFLWPRKEKSLAKPRSGGETPPRTESSCPARRSRAIEAWGGIRQAMTLPTPHPSPLPQGERGQSRNPVEGRALVSCMAKPCHSHVGRHCTRQ